MTSDESFDRALPLIAALAIVAVSLVAYLLMIGA